MYPTLRSRDDLLKMLDELTEHRAKILDRCAALPIEKQNDPVYPGTWSVLENLGHIAWAQEYMLAWIRKRPNALPREEFPKQAPNELDAIRVALDEAMAACVAFLKSEPESVLTEPCVYGRALTEQTVGGIFFHVVEHEIGHRAFVLHKLAKLEGK